MFQTAVRTTHHAKKMKLKERKYEEALKQSARSEMLLTEQQGYVLIYNQVTKFLI